MIRRVSAEARRELVLAVAERYQGGRRSEKIRILDEFVAVTGYHRKHAIRVLTNRSVLEQPARPQRDARASSIYGESVREALIVLWEASDRVCGKRLKPLLALLVPALERHGHLKLDEHVRRCLLGVSAATIDRLLGPTRAAAWGRTRRARATPALRRAVPVRTFADWKDPEPGYMEGDLVAHSGETTAGSFIQTLVLTDVATGWTECVALVVREGTLVVEALERLRATMPFPLRGLDTDNGSEFMNETVVQYCASHGIELTRSRPYRKNDQAWVEQKNGAVVRRLVGYGRLEWRRSRGTAAKGSRRPRSREGAPLPATAAGAGAGAANYSVSWSERFDLPVMRTRRPLWTSRSAIAEAAAELWKSLPQSLKGRFVVTIVDAR
jgi:hypothetical protein